MESCVFCCRCWREGYHMAVRKRNYALPNDGAAFLMPLSDGRFGVCRVLRRSLPEGRRRPGDTSVLVAASPWIGTEAPDRNDPLLREILMLTHHSHDNAQCVVWVSDPVPESFVP